jgi:hypothetical protein
LDKNKQRRYPCCHPAPEKDLAVMDVEVVQPRRQFPFCQTEPFGVHLSGECIVSRVGIHEYSLGGLGRLARRNMCPLRTGRCFDAILTQTNLVSIFRHLQIERGLNDLFGYN